MPVWMFGVIIVSVTWLMTLAFNRSGGSILPGCLLHAAFNLSGTLAMSTGLIPYEWYFPLMCAFYPLLAALVFVSTRGKHLGSARWFQRPPR